MGSPAEAPPALEPPGGALGADADGGGGGAAGPLLATVVDPPPSSLLPQPTKNPRRDTLTAQSAGQPNQAREVVRIIHPIDEKESCRDYVKLTGLCRANMRHSTLPPSGTLSEGFQPSSGG